MGSDSLLVVLELHSSLMFELSHPRNEEMAVHSHATSKKHLVILEVSLQLCSVRRCHSTPDLLNDVPSHRPSSL